MSDTKGQFGGYNGKEKIYGKLDCKSANNWIKKDTIQINECFLLASLMLLSPALDLAVAV